MIDNIHYRHGELLQEFRIYARTDDTTMHGDLMYILGDVMHYKPKREKFYQIGVGTTEIDMDTADGKKYVAIVNTNYHKLSGKSNKLSDGINMLLENLDFWEHSKPRCDSITVLERQSFWKKHILKEIPEQIYKIEIDVPCNHVASPLFPTDESRDRFFELSRLPIEQVEEKAEHEFIQDEK
ncbi:MAG TPA: hypothetical protein DEP72_06180 [Clostridiales bacterium]|nr:MAG: hypothetical protein A2Y18_01595 [Clostridiales bacterium GWD2_32_19]HCC07727.1 hypothetical protein [Clostridiales bacterium]